MRNISDRILDPLLFIAGVILGLTVALVSGNAGGSGWTMDCYGGLSVGAAVDGSGIAYQQVECLGDIVPTPTPVPVQGGILLNQSEIMALPANGPAWDSLNAQADASWTVNIQDQNNQAEATMVSLAIRWVRLGNVADYNEAIAMLDAVMSTEWLSSNTALGLSRNLTGYVVAADILGLADTDPVRSAAFKAWLEQARTVALDGKTLISTHETRPNNWGTHAGAARMAVDLYLNDTADLGVAVGVFQGWLGDRAAYSSFSWGEMSWQCDQFNPVGINATGCLKDGHSIDGVLPDDQRRGGPFTWPPPKENYVWEALQGVEVQAWILSRAGYPAWGWQNSAILRAVEWLHTQASYPAEGDDTGLPWVINSVYGTGYPTSPGQPGKNGLYLALWWATE